MEIHYFYGFLYVHQGLFSLLNHIHNFSEGIDDIVIISGAVFVLVKEVTKFLPLFIFDCISRLISSTFASS